MAGLELRWDATPEGMRAVCEGLSAALGSEEFYLAGGTALALLEGHRLSEDLDLFSPKIGEPLSLAQRIAASGLEVKILSTARETLYLSIAGIQVSFIGSAYPLLDAPMLPADGGVPLASRDDLAAMKLAALASRGSRKDFTDIWVLASRHRSLADCLRLFHRKYGADVGHVIRSLVYFDEADAEPPLRMLVDVSWDRIKSDLKSWTEALIL